MLLYVVILLLYAVVTVIVATASVIVTTHTAIAATVAVHFVICCVCVHLCAGMLLLSLL